MVARVWTGSGGQSGLRWRVGGGRMTGPRRQRAQVWAGVYAALFGAGVAESDTDDSAVRSSEHDPERDVA